MVGRWGGTYWGLVWVNLIKLTYIEFQLGAGLGTGNLLTQMVKIVMFYFVVKIYSSLYCCCY